jgi:hypothetical protein
MDVKSQTAKSNDEDGDLRTGREEVFIGLGSVLYNVREAGQKGLIVATRSRSSTKYDGTKAISLVSCCIVSSGIHPLGPN